MGMYDTIRCKYPLPVEGACDLEYQTKDTPTQYCDDYEIREDGTLWYREYDYDVEDRSDPSAPKGSLGSVLGCMTRVNGRWVPCNHFLGEIRFYTNLPSETLDTEGWIEWSTYFVGGKLQHVHLVENTQPSDGTVA